jgi:hypothetical protein
VSVARHPHSLAERRRPGLDWRSVPLAVSPRTPPHITVEGARLADTLARAVELAEEMKWNAVGKAGGGATGTAAP